MKRNVAVENVVEEKFSNSPLTHFGLMAKLFEQLRKRPAKKRKNLANLPNKNESNLLHKITNKKPARKVASKMTVSFAITRPEIVEAVAERAPMAVRPFGEPAVVDTN